MKSNLRQILAKFNQLTLQKQEANRIKGIVFKKFETTEVKESI